MPDTAAGHHRPPAWRLRLRRLAYYDEDEFTDAQKLMSHEGWTFGPERDHASSWDGYLELIDDLAEGRRLPAGITRSSFLAADCDGVIIGGVTIRWKLTPELMQKGGNIGYGVLPQFRRDGYGTEMLLQSLVLLHEAGITDALITCSEGNIASKKLIETCNGVLHDITGSECRYMIRTS